MDSEISGTVLSAAPRIVGNNKTIYDVNLSDGNTYTTFDAKLWAKVAPLIGQAVSARVAVKQNGNYTNFYLNDIAPAGQLAATSAPVATPAPQAAPQPARAQGGMSAEDKARVTFLSCLSSAAQGLANGLDADEVLLIADKFYDYTANGLYKQTEQPQTAQEPVAAAAADNGKGDGIPW